LITQQLAAGPA
jgi:hypothetical protein